MAVFVPLPGNVLQRNLAHEDCVLVLLNVKVLQISRYLQLMLWSGEETGKRNSDVWVNTRIIMHQNDHS